MKFFEKLFSFFKRKGEKKSEKQWQPSLEDCQLFLRKLASLPCTYGKPSNLKILKNCGILKGKPIYKIENEDAEKVFKTACSCQAKTLCTLVSVAETLAEKELTEKLARKFDLDICVICKQETSFEILSGIQRLNINNNLLAFPEEQNCLQRVIREKLCLGYIESILENGIRKREFEAGEWIETKQKKEFYTFSFQTKFPIYLTLEKEGMLMIYDLDGNVDYLSSSSKIAKYSVFQNTIHTTYSISNACPTIIVKENKKLAGLSSLQVYSVFLERISVFLSRFFVRCKSENSEFDHYFNVTLPKKITREILNKTNEGAEQEYQNIISNRFGILHRGESISFAPSTDIKHDFQLQIFQDNQVYLFQFRRLETCFSVFYNGVEYINCPQFVLKSGQKVLEWKDESTACRPHAPHNVF